MNSKKQIFAAGILLLFIFTMAALSSRVPSAEASSPVQGLQYQTPTPGPDGRILYTVQEGDTCIRIALLHNISENQLRSLNPDLDENCTVIPGEKLLVGLGGPALATATPGASPTPTLVPPTPTPFNGTTEICVLLFEDINGDALRQEDEPGLGGGAVSVTSEDGAYSQTKPTLGGMDPDTGEPAPVCFSDDLPEGAYQISVAVPDGYNPTMNVSYRLDLHAGDAAYVDFGAQSAKSGNESASQEEGGKSGLLGLLGALLLFGGIGLAWYAMRAQRPRGLR